MQLMARASARDTFFSHALWSPPNHRQTDKTEACLVATNTKFTSIICSPIASSQQCIYNGSSLLIPIIRVVIYTPEYVRNRNVMGKLNHAMQNSKL